MVTLEAINHSNDLIKSTLQPGLVAVFVGGTNSVGETTARQFAKHAVKPRVYIVGRSEEAGSRIVSECQGLNPEGTFVFIQRDMSLMRNVDEACREIARKESMINILFLTIGTLQVNMKTAEGLHYSAALTVYARNRFITNLLPHISRASGLRRVVTSFGATFEGKISKTDFQGLNLNRMAYQAHEASITTLSLEALRKSAPEVSFIHNFPGAVESGIARGEIGPLMRVLKTIWGVLGSWVHIPIEEAGDRHVFLCTSKRFAADGRGEAGVPLGDGLEVARGVDGKEGSGVYSIDAYGESASWKVEAVLARLRDEGMVDWVQSRIEADIKGALAVEV